MENSVLKQLRGLRKSPAQLKGVKEFPYQEWDKEGRETYSETTLGTWSRRKFDDKGNQTYYEDFTGYYHIATFDKNGNMTSFEDATGTYTDDTRKTLLHIKHPLKQRYEALIKEYIYAIEDKHPLEFVEWFNPDIMPDFAIFKHKHIFSITKELNAFYIHVDALRLDIDDDVPQGTLLDFCKYDDDHSDWGGDYFDYLQMKKKEGEIW